MRIEVEVIYFGDEVEERLKRLFQDCIRFVPWWCERVCFYNSNSENASMHCDANKSYRNLDIGVDPKFLATSDARVRKVMLHEIAHGYNEGMTQCMRKFVVDFIEDEKQRELFKKIVMREVEGQTQDLAILFEGLMGNSKGSE